MQVTFVSRLKPTVGVSPSTPGACFLSSWTPPSPHCLRALLLVRRHRHVVAQLTEATKKALAEYIERRASAATTQALAEHRKAMQDAATLAFADQLAPAVRDIARQVELHGSLVRTRLAPVLAALALGVALGIGSAVLWMR